MRLAVWDDFTQSFIELDVEKILKSVKNLEYLKVEKLGNPRPFSTIGAGVEVNVREAYEAVARSAGLTDDTIREGLERMHKAGSKLMPRDKSGTGFRYKVASILQDVQDLLVEKNEAYGNSALDPINVFSKATSTEQLRVRIDDKLNRLYHGKEYGQEDTITDLIGYLVLLKIAEKEQTSE